MPNDLFTVENIFYQLLLMALLSGIAYLGKLFWKKILEPASNEVKPSLNLLRIKKQFLISLFTLIILFVVFVNITSVYIKFISFIGMFFCIIFVWGAFDAVYFFIDIKMKQHFCTKIPDESPDSGTDDPDTLTH